MQASFVSVDQLLPFANRVGIAVDSVNGAVCGIQNRTGIAARAERAVNVNAAVLGRDVFDDFV